MAPLAGLTVVEASRGVTVRYCGRLFTQLGATVVRAQGGDDQAIGYGGEAGEAYGRWLDEGKVAAAAGDVDLVVCDVPSGGRGLPGDPIRLEITWFHPDGPYAGWRGTDEIVQALAGVTWAVGPHEGPPVLAQGHGPQLCAGIVGFNAALGALLGRQRPARLQVNVLEAYLCLMETGAISALLGGGEAVRVGVNRFVPTYPCFSGRTADGWVGVTALTPAQWRGFCRMIGKPELASEPRFTTAVQRLLLADEVDALTQPPLLARTTAEWVAMGLAQRVPITPMPDLRQLPQADHWQAWPAFAPFDDSGVPAPTLPFRIEPGGGPARPVAGGAADAPLKGLRIVDFTMGWAGPLCTRTLGDLGAEVIKIESESHMDWWRGWEVETGDPPPHEVKFSFISVNRNKRAVALDMATSEGKAAVEELVRRADVLVENFAAGTMDKLGLGKAARRRLNPGLIAVAMPAFGSEGPLSGVRAYGSTVEQASGLPFANGHADWPPSLQHVAFGDPISGLYAAAAVLAALRARTEGGAEIDLAQVASLFQFGADAMIAQHLREGPLPRTGSRRPRMAPVAVVAAIEGNTWLAVAVDGDAAWDALADALERPDWRGLGHAARADLADEIEVELAAWAGPREVFAAAMELQAAGVPAAPVQPSHTLCYDPQLSTTGFFPEMHRRYVGDHLVPAAPWIRDGERPALYRPAPTLGEHTAEVLAELASAP